jgi:uncharacterized protein (UPF0332 family)
MMRSPNLEDCLNGPHLWFDEAASNLVAKDLEIADKFLVQAKEKKDPIDQLNTAYQAMYCGSQALLHSIQYKASGFRCMITVLKDYFVKNELLDRNQVDHLIRAQMLEGNPLEAIAAAEQFVIAAKEALKKNADVLAGKGS